MKGNQKSRTELMDIQGLSHCTDGRGGSIRQWCNPCLGWLCYTSELCVSAQEKGGTPQEGGELIEIFARPADWSLGPEDRWNK
eukprot:6430407-Amphidinium_carterae.1